MYKVTTIFERPEETVPYYIETLTDLRAEFLKFTDESPELLLVNNVDETPNKNVTEAFYADESEFNKFIQRFNEKFPSFFEDRDNYHNSVGITVSRIVSEI